MTTRYIGMNRNTGRTITDADHISQSMSDILRTPVGSRVMRRDYGSLLSSLIDMPQNDALNLQLMSACYMALLKWEPSVTITWLTIERQFTGQMVVDLTGEIKGSGDPLSLTIPVS
ncbi:GPW/gp25 family protein (plasmid) [Pantoea dispersa]|uniref:GPW/gp25 family protein n=1 Tax=Pantoea TaxID=53335 RepID=UPI001419CFC5|nr:GPW/gp25 family protein [Pantoea sp. Ap-870]NIE51723.1 baseplate assembly protein [Pantoea sp. Ap-870]